MATVHVQLKRPQRTTPRAMEDGLIIIEAPVQEPFGEEVDAWELVEEDGDGETALSSLPSGHAPGRPAEAHVDGDEATAGAEHEAAAGSSNVETCDPAGSPMDDGAPRLPDEEDEEYQGENDTTGTATGEIEMIDGEEPSGETASCCTEELKSACEELCARSVERLRHAKEFSADLNAKAHVALGELSTQLMQAYTDATGAAAVCFATVQEQAKQAAGKIKNAVAEMDNIPDQPGLAVLTSAMVVATLLVVILSWLASSGGVAEVAPHNQIHMETLTLLEREMGRLQTTHYHNAPIRVAQPPAPCMNATKKSRAATKKNRTAGLGRPATAAAGAATKARGGQTRKDTQEVARINPTDMLSNVTINRPNTLVACEQPRATNISDDTPTSTESTALVYTASLLPAEGWFTTKQRISEASMNHTPLKIMSALALGDGTMWPTIPLPSSPTIRPPISMPPIAMPMLPVDSAISMLPVAIPLGSSDNVLLTNAIAIRPSSILQYSSSYLNLVGPTVTDGEVSPRCYGKATRNSTSASIANGTQPWSAHGQTMDMFASRAHVGANAFADR